MGSSSYFLEILTNVFLKFVILFKSISIPKKSTVNNIDIENIFLFSDKNYQTISNRFPKVKSIMKIEGIKIGSYVILDPNFLSHEKIIDLIQNQNHKYFIFYLKINRF